MARTTMEVVREGRTTSAKIGKYNERLILRPVRCADGTEMSVQASSLHYASPRNDAGPYTAVEVWFPGEPQPIPWVPVEQVEAFIEAHGGEAQSMKHTHERTPEQQARIDALKGQDEEAEAIAAKEKQLFDLTGQLMAYEDGELDEEQFETLFQYLVNSGLAWSLQGHYGRTAAALIEAGRIDPGHGQNVAAN